MIGKKTLIILGISLIAFIFATAGAFAFRPGSLLQLSNLKKCLNCDLTSADLSGQDINGADLQGANMTGANLSSTNLSGANLRNVELAGAKLSNAN
jgi:uncharacterized protein YjbI with pentapeptide repeats